MPSWLISASALLALGLSVMVANPEAPWLVIAYRNLFMRKHEVKGTVLVQYESEDGTSSQWATSIGVEAEFAILWPFVTRYLARARCNHTEACAATYTTVRLFITERDGRTGSIELPITPAITMAKGDTIEFTIRARHPAKT